MERLSEDFKGTIISALDGVLRQYLSGHVFLGQIYSVERSAYGIPAAELAAVKFGIAPLDGVYGAG
jgi:hypothetical protein